MIGHCNEIEIIRHILCDVTMINRKVSPIETMAQAYWLKLSWQPLEHFAAARQRKQSLNSQLEGGLKIIWKLVISPDGNCN